MSRAILFLFALVALAPAGEPKVYVHAPAEDLLTLFPEKGAGFLISADEYRKLLDLARTHEKSDEAQPPLAGRLVRGAATAKSDGGVLRIETSYVAIVNGDRPVEIPFRLENVALERIAVEGGELVGESLRFGGAGTFMVTASLSAQLATDGGIQKAAFRLPPAAAHAVTIALPPDTEGEVGPIVRAFRSPAEGGSVVAYPDGSGLLQLWMRPLAPARALDPILSAAFQATASLGDARTLVATNLALEVLRSPIRQVNLLLEPGQILHAVSGKGLKTWRIVRGPGGPGTADRLEVVFVEPLQGRADLTIEAEMPRDKDGEVGIPIARVEGAVRFRGTVGILSRPEVRVTALAAEGARRLDRLPAEHIALYEVWSEGSRVRATVEKVASKTRAITQALLYLHEGGKSLRARLFYSISGTPLFRLEPTLPKGWILRQFQLDGAEVEHRYEEDGRVVLVFPQGLALGGHAIDLLLETDEVDWVPGTGAATLDFAGLRAGLDEESGHLVVASDPAFRVGVEGSNGLSPVGIPEILRAGFPENEKILYTWRFDQPGYAARFRLERHLPQIGATVVQQVKPSERRMDLRAAILLDIQRTGVRELKVALPKGTGKLVHFDGPMIKERRPPAEGSDPEVWTIILQKRIRGPYRLDVSFDRNFDADTWEGSVPEITIPNAQERGFLVIEAGATTAIKVDASGLRSADVDELPFPPANPPLDVFAYARHPYAVTIRSKRHDPHEVVQAVALSAEIYGVLTHDGRLRCRAEYRIRNNDQPFLLFGLPPGSSLLGVVIDGNPSKPLLEKGRLKVALPRSKDREAPFVVALVYESGVEPLDDKGDVTIARPVLDIDVLSTSYTLHLPRGYTLTGHDGDMVPTTDSERSGVAEILGGLVGELVPLDRAAAGAVLAEGKGPAPAGEPRSETATRHSRPGGQRRMLLSGGRAAEAPLDEVARSDDAPAESEKDMARESLEGIESDRDMEDGAVDRKKEVADKEWRGPNGAATPGEREPSDFEPPPAPLSDPAAPAKTPPAAGAAFEVAKGGEGRAPTPKPGAPVPPPRQRPERALLSLDVQFLKPDNVHVLKSLSPSGAVTISYARSDVFAVRRYLGYVIGAAVGLFLVVGARVSLLRTLIATVLIVASLHFAGASLLPADFAVGAAVAASLCLLLEFRRLFRWIRHRRQAAAAAALLLLAGVAGAQEEVFVPYSGGDPGRVERVFLPASEYHRLRERAYPELAGRATALSSAEYAAELKGEEVVLRARYAIVKETPEAERIPLRLDGVAVTGAMLDGKPATLTVEKEGYLLVLKGKGRFALDLTLRPRLEAKGDARSFAVPVVPAAGATLALTHDRPGHEVHVAALGAGARGFHQLGPVATVAATWTPKTESFAAADAELRADTEAVIAARDGFTGLAARIRYGIAGGQVDRLRVRLGKDLIVRAVGCADLAGWAVDADGVLSVALSKPATTSVTVEIRAERPAAREREEEFPLVEPLGVVRDAGVIAIETLPDLKIELLDTQGLLRGRTEQAPQKLEAASDRGAVHSVHRFAVRPYRLRYRIFLEETRLRAEDAVDLLVERESATAEVTLRVEVERGPGPYTVPLRVPAGYEVLSAEGNLRDWWVRDATLHMERLVPQKGAESYRVVLRRRGGTASPFEAPAVLLPGAVRESGRIRVAVADGLELDEVEATGLLPEDVANAGDVRWGRLRRSYRFVAVPWRLLMKTREERREVEALTVSRVVPLADRLRVEALVNFHVERGLVDEVSFVVPVAGESEALISMPDLREERSEAVEGGRRFTLALRTPTRGSVAVAVTYFQPYDAPLRGIEPEGASRVRRYVAVEKVPDGEVRVASATNLENGDFADLPLAPPETTPQTVARVFVGSGGPYAIDVKVQRHSFEEVAAAVIYRAAATAVVDLSGWTRVHVAYRVFNRSEQFLRLRLPAKATLYSVFVAGEGVRPLGEQGAVLVPLRKLAVGSPSFEVDLVYATRVSRVGDGEFPVELPRIENIDVRRTTLTLHVPKGFSYDFDTKMEKVDEAYLAAGEATDIYQEAKENYAVVERGSSLQALRALSNAIQLEEDALRAAERVQTVAADSDQRRQIDSQNKALALLREASQQEMQAGKALEVQQQEQSRRNVQDWGVNDAYLDRNKASDNRDLQEFGEKLRKQSDMGQQVDEESEAPLFGGQAENSAVGIGGGAGGGGGGKRAEHADARARFKNGGEADQSAVVTFDTTGGETTLGFATFFVDEGREGQVDAGETGVDLRVGRRLDDNEPGFLGRAGEGVGPSTAKGRISIRIPLPESNSEVFHFARLGAEGGLAVDASKSKGHLFEGLLAILCLLGAVIALRAR